MLVIGPCAIALSTTVTLAKAAEKPACESPVSDGACIEVLHDFAGPAFADGQYAYASPVIDGNGAVYGTTRRGGKYDHGILYRSQSGGFKVLHHFQSGSVDGESPSGSLVVDTNGNVYGTADSVIYRYDAESGYRIIKTLRGADGINPFGGLIRDAVGNLYGTSRYAGDSSCTPFGCGTVFKVDSRCVGVADWSADAFCLTSGYTVLHRFTISDSSNPSTALTRSGTELFGTTAFSIFRVSSSGFEVLRGYGGDAYNYSGLVKDPNSQWLYGVSKPGVIFRIDAFRNFEIVYRFTGPLTGTRPTSELLIDAAAGKLYGTTLGADTDSDPAATDGANNGTVFEFDLRRFTARTLYTFRLCDAGRYGNKPVGGLTRDGSGNLYGVTNFGGASGNGVLFRINLRCFREVLLGA